MSRRQRYMIVLGTVGVLYLVTWLAGGRTYRRNFTDRVMAEHAAAGQRERDQRAFAAKEGLDYEDMGLLPSPHISVDWCVPLAPGVLLANSSYVHAGLWGQGGLKLVLYYVGGTVEIPMGNWRS